MVSEATNQARLKEEVQPMRMQDLRSFVELFAKTYPQEFIRISDRVTRNFDITAVVLELERRRRFPIVRFEDVNGSEMPVICNIYGHRRNFALALGTDVDRMPSVYAERLKDFVKPVVVRDPPFRHSILTGEELDLNDLPILTHFPGDGGPYITAGMLIAKDPHTGVQTMGYHRLQVHGPRRMGVSLHSRRRMFEYHRRAEERGQNLECAIAIGLHPVVGMGALSYPPIDISKFEVIGGLLQEPMQISPCTTLDCMVPTWTEIVIEGEILAGVREEEGPFGEFTGYFSSRSTNHVFLAKSIMKREGAWYQCITPGRAADDVLAPGLLREAELLKTVSRFIPNVKAVHVPQSGCAAFSAFISIRQTRPGEAKQTISIAFSVDHYLKFVVIVDDDVDVFDESEVLWAITTRAQANRDLLVISDAMGTMLDPSATTEGLTAKVGIDATRPFGEAFAERLALSPETEAWARELVDRTLPVA